MASITTPSLPTRPFLAVYVVWHPSSSAAEPVADFIYRHFRREIFSNVAGGTGLSVTARYAVRTGSTQPEPIDLGGAETNAIVVIADDAMAADQDWLDYVSDLIRDCDRRGLGHHVFPVALTSAGMNAIDMQAVRWHEWSSLSEGQRQLRLRTDLSHQFSRMLRHYLEHLRRPGLSSDALEAYLEPVRIFLSHSKHDADGKNLANATRDYLHNNTEFGSFFDVRNIPPGLHFQQVLIQYVRVSAVVAFHTDSYSTREWCRREILEAKRHHVPIVVGNAIFDSEERGFPYMANVPVVRIDRRKTRERIPIVIACLLDEVLKDYLWRCRVELVRAAANPNVSFLPRPPELLMLAALAEDGRDLGSLRLVYPDPPIAIEEAKLFGAISPSLVLQSYTEWLGEFGA